MIHGKYLCGLVYSLRLHVAAERLGDSGVSGSGNIACLDRI